MMAQLLPFLAILTLAAGCGGLPNDWEDGVAGLPSDDLNEVGIADPTEGDFPTIDPTDETGTEPAGTGPNITGPSGPSATPPSYEIDFLGAYLLDPYQCDQLEIVIAGIIAFGTPGNVVSSLCVSFNPYSSSPSVVPIGYDNLFKTSLAFSGRLEPTVSVWPLTEATCHLSALAEEIAVVEVDYGNTECVFE